MLARCKQAFERHYGTKLANVILFGSASRGEDTAESDFDLLVVLKPPFEFFRELRVIVDLLDPIQMGCDRLISAKPAEMEEFQKGTIQLYRNVAREGIPL